MKNTFKPTNRQRMCLAAIKVYANKKGHWMDSTEIGQMMRFLQDSGFNTHEIFTATTQAHIEEVF
jgi:hypothetical protein